MKVLVAVTVLCLTLGGCAGKPASAEECSEIFERIVDNELREKGFRDPALFRRKKESLREAYAADLRRCVGRTLPKNAMACVRSALSNEDLSHKCLR